jgi:ABC-2 type transport system permease protein
MTSPAEAPVAQAQAAQAQLADAHLPPLPQTGFRATCRRIAAMVMRYIYLLLGSWPRIFELAYWPTFQVILWGLITLFLLKNSTWVAQAAGVLIAAALLWDVLFRGELGVSVSFLEEMWSRNIGNLAVAPLRPYEFATALLSMSMIRTLIGTVPATLVAVFLYKYSVYEMGLPLLAFFVNLLVMGWAFGLAICALLIRWGLGAENLAWLAIFAVAPISAIYYPVSVLPHWAVTIAYALPSAHVFEGMREVLFQHTFNLRHFFAAAGLNVVYLSLGFAAFLYAHKVARRRGLILQTGE